MLHQPDPAADDDHLGFKAAFATIGKNGFSAQLRQQQWAKLQAGDLTEAGAPSGLLRAAKQEMDRGSIKNEDDYGRFIDHYFKGKNPAPLGQSSPPAPAGGGQAAML